jgi:hypothetical protein
MGKPNLRLVTPTTENQTVTPQRASNAELRTREHLTTDEVEKLVEVAKANRKKPELWGERRGVRLDPRSKPIELVIQTGANDSD